MAKPWINRAGTVVRRIATFVVVGSLAGVLPGKLSAQNSEPKTGCAPVHGLRLYYEIHGAGAPVLLLHGGPRAGQMFSPIMPEPSKNHRVIVLDLQGHGHTADIDGRLSMDAMAEDLAALLNYLGIAKADVMGYSLGGGVALRLAVDHPEAVNRIILVSTAFSREGCYPQGQAGKSQIGPAAAEPMKQTPMYQRYSSIAPRPEDWPVLLTKMGELLRKDYDWSKDVSALKAPTLLVFGNADAVQFFELRGGGKKGRGLGWIGHSKRQARHSARTHSLHDLCLTRPGLNCPAIFRISNLTGKERCKPEEVDFVNSERIST